MELFFRIFRHLLPDGLPWRIRHGEVWEIGEEHDVGEEDLDVGGEVDGNHRLGQFFWALTNPFDAAKQFIDLIYLDRFAASTREIAEYEYQFGLLPAPLEADRRTSIDAAWKATGGQSPRYLQDAVQAAGFALYLHEWWESGPPYVARDPREHTEVPLIGTVQCGEPLAQCGEASAVCNNFLANETGYLVNPLLSRAPVPVPNDPVRWPFFLYWGAETFPDRVTVPANRRRELEDLLLRLCPTEQWLVLLIDFE